MRIAIVSPLVVGLGMSPETYSSQQINLAARWAEAGHQVDIITLRGQGLQAAALRPGVTVHPRPGLLLGRQGLPLMFGVGDAVRGGGYDFVLASEHYQPATAAACMASRAVLIYQGQHWAGSSLKNRLLLRSAEETFGRVSRARCLGVVAKTSAAAQFVQARGFRPVQVIPCGYDETRFLPPSGQEREAGRRSLALAPDEHALVYAGKLLPVRDVASALRALAILRQRGRNVRLVVAGQGPEQNALQRDALELGVGDRVSFLGVLPWRRLRQVFWAGDAFLFPSRYEIFGLVLLEAMACGLPVVSTPVGGAADLIHDGSNGFLVPIGDPAAMAAAVERVLANPAVAAGLRETASNLAAEHTWTIVAWKMADYAASRLAAPRSARGSAA